MKNIKSQMYQINMKIQVVYDFVMKVLNGLCLGFCYSANEGPELDCW